MRRPGRTGYEQRGGITDSALELADHSLRLRESTALGRFADGQGAVLPQEEDGRDLGPLVPEWQQLTPVTTQDSCGVTVVPRSTPNR